MPTLGSTLDQSSSLTQLAYSISPTLQVSKEIRAPPLSTTVFTDCDNCSLVRSSSESNTQILNSLLARPQFVGELSEIPCSPRNLVRSRSPCPLIQLLHAANFTVSNAPFLVSISPVYQTGWFIERETKPKPNMWGGACEFLRICTFFLAWEWWGRTAQFEKCPLLPVSLDRNASRKKQTCHHREAATAIKPCKTLSQWQWKACHHCCWRWSCTKSSFCWGSDIAR